MCGISGAVGLNNISDELYQGIRNLEYRGYDSCGVALMNKKSLVIRKNTGGVEEFFRKENARLVREEKQRRLRADLRENLKQKLAEANRGLSRLVKAIAATDNDLPELITELDALKSKKGIWRRD